MQPALLFRYADLKDVMGKIVQRFACVRDQFPMNQQDKAAAKVSNILMTLCTHTRRLRDQSRLREACSTLTSWQSSKLEELRDLMNNKEPSSPQKGKKAKSSSSAAMASKAQAEEPSTPKKAKKTKSSSKLDDGGEACSIASLDTVDAMEIELPLTQESTNDLQNEADTCSPIPARKKTIKKDFKIGSKKAEPKETCAMKASKAMKAMKIMKKPGTLLPQNLASFKLTTMMYKTGACAVRIVGGKQLFQVSKFSPTVNKKKAQTLLDKLLAGEALDKVKEMKDKL